MKKFFSALFLTLALAFSMSSANAAVLNFDDVATDYYQQIDNGYHGFDWDNMYIINKNAHPDSGYDHGTVSLQNTAFNGFGSPSSMFSSQAFDFNGAYFTAAWENGLHINLVGLLNGVEKYSTQLIANTAGPVWYTANFQGIDTLAFSTNENSHFAMDNFTYNEPVPEPSSMVLGLMGISSLLGLRKKKAAIKA